MRILVGEDEPAIAYVYDVALEHRGHEVTVTTDGLECAEMYDKALSQFYVGPSRDQQLSQKIPFDVVILDYRMPKKDGIEVAKHIISCNPHQRIIIASAYANDTLQDSIRRLPGTVEILTKPFRIGALVDIIENRAVYAELQKLQVKVEILKEHNLTHGELVDLLKGLKKLIKKHSHLSARVGRADELLSPPNNSIHNKKSLD
ncbi:MAG: response regulator [Nitrososphaera sp.]|jgi:CheY-like chemotaxis protein